MNRYRRTQRWFRMNPEKRRKYNAKYYTKNAEALRARAAKVRANKPDITKAYNKRFREKYPTYLREYRQRVRLRTALSKFASVLAANRRGERMKSIPWSPNKVKVT